MNSLVLELQRKAIDSSVDVVTLVRMALVVATKLGLGDFEEWANRELNGYRDHSPPLYRNVRCEVRAHNPYHGWTPCLFENKKVHDAAHRAPCTNPIGEVQHLLAVAQQGQLIQLPFSHEVTWKLTDWDTQSVPTRLIGEPQIVGILDAVRNVILRWALELEKNKILGENMAFSQDEKSKAHSATTITIKNFVGVLGGVQSNDLQIGDHGIIVKELERRGISNDERERIFAILEEFKVANEPKKESLRTSALQWVLKHADKLGPLVTVIRGWFGC